MIFQKQNIYFFIDDFQFDLIENLLLFLSTPLEIEKKKSSIKTNRS